MYNFFNLNDDTDYKYLISQIGEEVIVNNIGNSEDNKEGEILKAITTNAGKIGSKYQDDKNITTLFEIKQGDFIEYNGLYWLIIFPVNKKSYGKYKGVMRAFNHIIPMEIEDKIIGVPVIAESENMGTKINIYLTEPKENIILTTQNNEITRKLKLNDEFTKWNRIYRIDSMDYTEAGIIRLKCSFQQLNMEEEFEEDKLVPWKEIQKDNNGNDNGDTETTYSFEGSEEIYYLDTEIYQAIKYINGEIDDTSCEITANSYPYTIKLIAEDTKTSEVVEKEILLRGMF